jgi:predicted ATP-dependent Lon-type protease
MRWPDDVGRHPPTLINVSILCVEVSSEGIIRGGRRAASGGDVVCGGMWSIFRCEKWKASLGKYQSPVIVTILPPLEIVVVH